MKQSIYLETSVVGAYLDNGEPFRRDLTIRWWEHEMSEYRAVVSPLVRRELERVPEPHRTGYLKLIGKLEQVELSDEAAILADGYIARGIFHRKYIGDALHAAKDTRAAIVEWREASLLDPSNNEALKRLRRAGAPPR